MNDIMTSNLFRLTLLCGFSIAASIDGLDQGGVAILDVVIPATRHDDLFYNVRLHRVKTPGICNLQARC